MRERPLSLAQLLRDFRLQCQSLAAENSAGYRLEFKRLSEVGRELSTRAGDLDANREKNRYPYILPYDHCRVILSPQDSEPHSDYINANYVPGGVSERDFICTQGPLKSTLADFWRMVWEKNVHIIVMVTNCKESNKVLCAQYWPQERTSVCYSRYQVTTVHQRHGPGCLITTMHLRQMGSPTERRITHYHYLNWLDRGVPQDLASFCSFTDHIRQQLDSTPCIGPAVVHCSAGVGRSGTVVAILWLMHMCARSTQPDVRRVVYDLRMHRMMMVQTLEQYIFIHSCLLHWMAGEKIKYRSRSVESSRRTDREQDPRQPTLELPPPRSSSRRGERQRHEHLLQLGPQATLMPAGIQGLLSTNLLERVRLGSTQTPSLPGLQWGRMFLPHTNWAWRGTRGNHF